MANRALIIDDDRLALDLLSFQLKDDGFEVVLADTGAEGLKHVRSSV